MAVSKWKPRTMARRLAGLAAAFRSSGRHRIHDEDRPRRTPLSTQQLLHRSGKAGKHIGQLCQAMHAKHGELAVRRILGTLTLAKKYGIASTDDACACR